MPPATEARPQRAPTAGDTAAGRAAATSADSGGSTRTAPTTIEARIIAATRGQVLLELPDGRVRARLPQGVTGSKTLTLQATSGPGQATGGLGQVAADPGTTGNPSATRGPVPTGPVRGSMQLLAVDGRSLSQPQPIRLLPIDTPETLPPRFSEPIAATMDRQTTAGAQRLGVVQLRLSAAPFPAASTAAAPSDSQLATGSGPTNSLVGIVKDTPAGVRAIQLGSYTLTPDLSLDELPELTPLTLRIAELGGLSRRSADQDGALDALARALLRDGIKGDGKKASLAPGPGLASGLIRLARQVAAPSLPAEADLPSNGPDGPAKSKAGTTPLDVRTVQADNSRGLIVPLGQPETGEVRPLGVWQSEKDQAEQDARRRFSFTLDLSALGQIRIDLLSGEGRIDATLTTAEPLSTRLRRELADLFGAGLELAGVAGTLVTKIDARAAAPPAPAPTESIEI